MMIGKLLNVVHHQVHKNISTKDSDVASHNHSTLFTKIALSLYRLCHINNLHCCLFTAYCFYLVFNLTNVFFFLSLGYYYCCCCCCCCCCFHSFLSSFVQLISFSNVCCFLLSQTSGY